MNLRTLISFTAVVSAAPLSAQVADEGILVIRAGTKEIGSEAFRVTSGQAGLRITTKATYVEPHPPVELTASLERSIPSGELAFQLEHRGGQRGSQVFAVQKRNRLTIRRVERGAEQASEAPASGAILLADSVFALYLQLLPLPSDSGHPQVAVIPQSGRRLSFTVRRLASPSGGTLIRFSGGLEGEMALGNRGELLRISLPALGLEASRKRD
jgi:hypothetical protein